jgi:soluble lytic murein transglycosylase
LARTLRTKPSMPVRTSLAAYAKANAKGENGALALLALAVNDIEGKTPERAIPVLKTLDRRLPKLADYVALFHAQALFDTGDFKGAAKAADDVKPGAIYTRASSLAAKALVESGDARKALALLRSRYESLEQPAGAIALATAMDAAGDDSRAIWTGLYIDSPRVPEAGVAVRRLGMALSAEQRLARGLKLIDFDPSEAQIELRAAAAGLSGEPREIAALKVGAAMHNARQYATALGYLETLKLTDPVLDAERLYWAVRSAGRAKELARMGTLAGQLARKHNGSRWATEALAAAGDRQLTAEDYVEARTHFAACAATKSDSPVLAYCQWRMAFESYFQRKPDAYRKLEAFVERWPKSNHSSAALYYLGRLAESMKDTARAQAFYSRVATEFANHYYATLARARGGVAETAPALDFAAAEPMRSAIDRASLLATAGLDDYAEREIRHWRERTPPHVTALALAKLTARRDEPDKAMRWIKGTYPGYLTLPLDAAPREFWRLTFPLPYREDVERYARAQGLDPFLVAGLIRQESEFNAKAISRSKAHGLMQVMPPTGRELARKLGIKPFSTSMLLNPTISLRMGTRHFKDWLDAEKGQVEVTLAAYNAGKTRADRWLARGPYREPSEFVESIPWQETRDYVQAVIRNADVYRRLYASAGRSF